MPHHPYVLPKTALNARVTFWDCRYYSGNQPVLCQIYNNMSYPCLSTRKVYNTSGILRLWEILQWNAFVRELRWSWAGRAFKAGVHSCNYAADSWVSVSYTCNHEMTRSLVPFGPLANRSIWQCGRERLPAVKKRGKKILPSIAFVSRATFGILQVAQPCHMNVPCR